MTIPLKPAAKAADAPNPDTLLAEPDGAIPLNLAPLGIDHLAHDFPVRFIAFCEQNNLYEMEVNGARLSRLIDTLKRQVHIYRAGLDEPQIRHDPETPDGKNVMPGFSFPVRPYVFEL